jgi:alpha-tubulin suppressor-like RCC1 family protein
MQKAKALAPDDKTIQSAFDTMAADNKGRTVPHQRSQGCVFTWGLYDSKALGHNDTKDKHSPAMVESLRGKHIVDVSCGAMHTVAVAGTGETFAWGDNRYGQIGVAVTRIDQVIALDECSLPTLVPALIGIHITAVSCGTGHTIAVAVDGSVFSWGLGAHGQLGHGNAEHLKSPLLIKSLRDSRVVAVSCGIAHTVFLLDGDKSIRGCGMNTYGALGINTEGESVLLPQDIPLPWRKGSSSSQSVGVAHVACGGAHTVVVGTDGSMYSCGSNSCGQLGLDGPDTTDFFSLTRVQEFRNDVSNVGGRSCVRCAYVACGEEFTIMISEDRYVYATGLGLAGQMGNGSTKNNAYFTCLSSLNGKHIEEVACAQGTVFGIAESGEVYTWGLPGDRHRETMLVQDSDSMCLTPALAGAFAKRKRARQICCGRKHYALLTIAPYGGTSYVVGASGPSESVQDPNEIELYEAGKKKLKCVIQTCDVKGEAVDYGGYVLSAVMSQIGDSGNTTWSCDGQNTDPSIPFRVDDNMDGTYSCESADRLNLAGKFHLAISLDGIAIMHSPFLVEVLPGDVSPSKCRVTRSRAGAARGDMPGVSDAAEQLHTVKCQRDEVIDLNILCLDRFCNYITVASYAMGTVHVKYHTTQGRESALHSSCDFPASWSPDTATLTASIRCPSAPGSYEMQLSFGEHGSAQLIGEGGVTVHCHGPSQYDPQRCNIRLPSRISVDNCPLQVEIDMKDANSDPLALEREEDRPDISCVVSPLSSEGVSARALIRLYTWQQNPYGPVAGTLSWELSLTDDKDKGVGSVAVLSHNVRVTGEAHVDLIIGNKERIYTAAVTILPGAPSPVFTELLNAKAALKEWEDNEEWRYVQFQCRDQYGNKCTDSGECVLVAEVWEEGREGKKVKLQVSGSPDEAKAGVMEIKVVRLSGQKVPHVLGVDMMYHGTRTELQYSPFTIGREFDYEEVIVSPSAVPPAALQIEEEMKMKKQRSAQEMTNRRAFEALRERRREMVKEKEARIRSKSARRTGGGFVIEYSKDI